MQATPTPPRPASIEISSDDFGREPHLARQVEIAEGATLTVTLPSNPSTGYSWTEQAQIADLGVLQQTGHRYIPAETKAGTPAAVGAPGTEEWTFKASTPGTTTFTLRYARPWQSDMGLWSLRLAVTVKAAPR